MSIQQSSRKICPDFIVNDFVTNIIKTVPLRINFNTVRVNLETDSIVDKTSPFCRITTLSVVCRNGCLVDIVDIVVKSATKNKKLRNCISVEKIFAKEVLIHKTILPELLQFQQEYGGRIDSQFEGAPFLIAASLDQCTETLILQDSCAGRKFEKWIGELNNQHIEALLKEFARLHALSFAFSRKHSEKHQQFKKDLSDRRLSVFENKQTMRIIKKNLEQSLSFFSANVEEALKKFAVELEDVLNNILNENNETDVLIHTDPVINFLFCNEKNSETTFISRAQFSDWHLVNFGSAVLDIILFLFTNCSHELTNLENLISCYHLQLTESLHQYSIDIDEMLPIERLEEDWPKYAKFGLAMSFLNLQIVSLNPNHKPNANNEDLTPEEFIEGFVQPPNEEFARRLKNIVEYLISFEII